MAEEDSTAEGILKLGLGIGVGFGLYLLIQNFGFGGFGFGGTRDTRGAGRGDGQGAASPPPAPPSFPSSSPPVPPPIPRDDQPLLYVVVHPDGFQEASKLPDPTSRARADAIFWPIDLGTAEVPADELYRRMSDVLRREQDQRTTPLSLDDVIARIQAGGRDDVRLLSPGSIRQGTWDAVKDALMAAGIKHWILWREAPADRQPDVPPKPSRWDLYDKVSAVGNPDQTGHYLFQKSGTAYWNLARADAAPRVSGNARGEYGHRK